MLHENPTHFVQVVENALDVVYKDFKNYKWEKIHRWYESRYLNPDSPFKSFLKLYGYDAKRSNNVTI